MSESQEEHDVMSIVMAAVAGDATDEQLAQLNCLIVADCKWSTFLVRLMSQEAWLAWHATEARTVHDAVNQLTEEEPSDARSLISQLALGSDYAVADCQGRELRDSVANQPRGVSRRLRATMLALAASLLVAVGAVGGMLANRWVADEHGGYMPIAVYDSRSPADQVSASPAIYQARVLHSANCVWSPAMDSRLAVNNTLQSGDSINLIEGLAELELNWATRGNASLRLEGPAGLVLLADGGASLNYGKLTARVALDADSFSVETPIGTVAVQGNAHFGVAVSSGTVEVHVFEGWAELVTSGLSSTQSPDKLRIRSGRSIRMSATGSGEVDVARGLAALSRFASQVSMESDLLDISDAYADAIKAAGPEIYWRFNEPAGDVVPNEMSDKYVARVVGKPNWVEELGNMTVEFGAELDVDVGRTYVVTEEPLSGVGRENYTIELWAKPGHYHLGSMVALATPPGNADRPQGLHGALLELGGPRVPYSSIEHPGRVRFLHRDPPTWEPAAGTSCFSNQPYVLRRWQHFAAVKDGSTMRLYVDGQQVATAEDKTSLSDGLELLVGQIDRERNLRPFVGQVDELAFYGRALTESEVQRHHQVVRPQRKPAEGI